MTVRKITMNGTGDKSEEAVDLESFQLFDWSGRTLLVSVNNEVVLSYEELLREIEKSPLSTPEVVLYPPMAGGC